MALSSAGAGVGNAPVHDEIRERHSGEDSVSSEGNSDVLRGRTAGIWAVTLAVRAARMIALVYMFVFVVVAIAANECEGQ